MKEHLFSVTKDDLVIQTFRSGGKGGQNQNKVETGVRIIHPDSGAIGECRETRHQGQNKRIAFRRMAQSAKFTTWIHQKADEIIKGKTIEQQVEKLMEPSNIKIEVKDDRGRWTEATHE